MGSLGGGGGRGGGGGGGEILKKRAMWLYPKVLGFNPPERWGHSACYSDGLVYVFGGCCGGLHFSDVLVLNLDTMLWSSLVTTGQGPGPIDSHSAVLHGYKLIVFGGTNGSKKVNDLYILDLRTKEWMRPECKGIPPSPRESHSASLVGEERLVIFGGSGEGDGNYLNDLHVLDLNTMTWTSPEVKGDVPVPRDSHGCVAIGNAIYVYGGDCGDRYHGEVYMLDMGALSWSLLAVQGSLPGVRAGHATVNIGTKIYVIGGVGNKHYYNDIWVLDVSTCSWTQLDICGQKPQGRFSHAGIVTDSDIVIYGGCGEDERPINELLVLHLGAELPIGHYNISTCKIFRNHWNQGRRRLPRGEEYNTKAMIFRNNVEVMRMGVNEPESEAKTPSGFNSDTMLPKRKRPADSKGWEVELEQEEHSLSLSQNSSPSQSDQEQTPVGRTSESIPGSQGHNLFKKFNLVPGNFKPNSNASNHKELGSIIQITPDVQFLGEHQKQPKQEQFLHASRLEHSAVEHTVLESGPIPNLFGAEVRGRVDGAFDSGFLMTAYVNGKLFRGVLFAPAPSVGSRNVTIFQNPSSWNQISVPQLFPNAIDVETLKRARQLREMHMPDPPNYREAKKSKPFPGYRAAASMAKDEKLRSDLQGVVLTLGGPGGS